MIEVVFYAPDKVIIHTSAVAKRVSKRLEGKEVTVRRSPRPAPCVLATITDTESVAWKP